MSEYLKIFFLSMAPIVELRLSLVIGLIGYDGLDPRLVIISCVLGNFLICVPILYFLNYFDRLSESSSFLNKILNKVYSRTRSKSHVINKYNYFGIVLFVGIPLPLTGAWTGCLASHLLGLDRKKTLISVFLGLIISSGIVASIAIFAQHFLPYLGIHL